MVGLKCFYVTANCISYEHQKWFLSWSTSLEHAINREGIYSNTSECSLKRFNNEKNMDGRSEFHQTIIQGSATWALRCLRNLVAGLFLAQVMAVAIFKSRRKGCWKQALLFKLVIALPIIWIAEVINAKVNKHNGNFVPFFFGFSFFDWLGVVALFVGAFHGAYSQDAKERSNKPNKS